jgi:hypothetical protein
MQPRSGHLGLRVGGAITAIAIAIAALAGLVAVYQLYVGGNPVLAAACAGGFGLALFVFTARRAYTYRYLFPGLAGIALFVVLPLIYTVWIGFTNYSSRNLLTFERVTEVLLDEVYEQSDVRYQFTLHAAEHGYRLVLRTGDEAEAAEAAAAAAQEAQHALAAWQLARADLRIVQTLHARHRAALAAAEARRDQRALDDLAGRAAVRRAGTEEGR